MHSCQNENGRNLCWRRKSLGHTSLLSTVAKSCLINSIRPVIEDQNCTVIIYEFEWLRVGERLPHIINMYWKPVVKGLHFSGKKRFSRHLSHSFSLPSIWFPDCGWLRGTNIYEILTNKVPSSFILKIFFFLLGIIAEKKEKKIP